MTTSKSSNTSDSSNGRSIAVTPARSAPTTNTQGYIKRRNHGNDNNDRNTSNIGITSSTDNKNIDRNACFIFSKSDRGDNSNIIYTSNACNTNTITSNRSLVCSRNNNNRTFDVGNTKQ